MSSRSWGALSRTTPFSTRFGLDRGTPVDRVFIETFLFARAHLVRGKVLEISEDAYASRLRVDRDGSLDIVDIDPDNTDATIIADLCSPGSLPPGATTARSSSRPCSTFGTRRPRSGTSTTAWSWAARFW